MNELLIKRYEKQVAKYGVGREMARDIVLTAYETGKGKNIEMYINYAIDLVYGLGFTQRFSKIN